MGIFFAIIGLCALLVILAITPWMLWHLLRAMVVCPRWIVSNFMAGWREEEARDTPLPAWCQRLDARLNAMETHLERKLEHAKR